MIVDHRIYTLHPGRMADALALLEAEALPIQRRYLGDPLGYFQTEIGPLNRLVHLWGYASLADREARRAAMLADPAWTRLKQRTAALAAVQQQENWILTPLPFSPIGGRER